MSDLPHLRIEGIEQSAKYTNVAAGPVNAVFQLPARNKPVHARKIRSELEAADTACQARRTADASAHPELLYWVRDGVVLTFKSDPGHELKLERLEDRQKGIHLLSLMDVEGSHVAKVFVPEGQLSKFLTAVDRYATNVVLAFTTELGNAETLKALEDRGRDIKFRGPIFEKAGVAKLRFNMPEAEVADFQARVGSLGTLLETSRPNAELVESVSSIRLAIVEDFWQDRLPFPAPETELWWEIWLRGNRADAFEVHSRFVEIARIVGITRVSDRHVAFPERIVVHAYASARQLSASIDLLALLAELRQAKQLASHFIELQPADQAALVHDAAARLVPPGPEATSVCILDWGINRGHPLIEPVLAEADAHAVDQAWGVSDSDPNQHGTGMAGIAMYG